MGMLVLRVQKPTRELSVKEIISLSFSLYKSNFIVFLIPALAEGVVSGIWQIMGGYIVANFAALTRGVFTSFFWNLLMNLIPVLFVSNPVSSMATIPLRGVCVKYASDLLSEGHADIRKTLGLIRHKLVSLLAVAIVTSVLMAVGFLAFIVPCVILALMFYLVVPVVIIEDVGVLDSLSRSRRLVSKRWRKTAYLLISSGIYAAVVLSLFRSLGGRLGFVYSGFLGYIASAFFTPIIPISVTIYYYSMLAREQQNATIAPT